MLWKRAEGMERFGRRGMSVPYRKDAFASRKARRVLRNSACCGWMDRLAISEAIFIFHLLSISVRSGGDDACLLACLNM